ncbi:MAG: acetyl-CoA carboxylase biotin carboxyl carrier protein [Treponema sp.]|jgi:acetyl-CoA carboxylase biotin carboxyl carrier protein|nr:acetyl-CoA carboxylase biotin carboxyl carrier protein [Treponema sp.]
MNDSLILTLLDRFSASSVTELDLQDGTAHLILRKAQGLGDVRLGSLEQGKGPQDGLNAAGPGEAHFPGSLDTKAEAPGETITSPMVATFYASPGPDTPAFVSPGSQVKTGDTLCILEAMKMMNRLEAEFDCEILAVHAGTGELVEYGQVLFEVKRISPSP